MSFTGSDPSNDPERPEDAKPAASEPSVSPPPVSEPRPWSSPVGSVLRGSAGTEGAAPAAPREPTPASEPAAAASPAPDEPATSAPAEAQPEPAAKADKPEKPAKAEKPAKPAKAEKPAKPNKDEQRRKSGKASKAGKDKKKGKDATKTGPSGKAAKGSGAPAPDDGSNDASDDGRPTGTGPGGLSAPVLAALGALTVLLIVAVVLAVVSSNRADDLNSQRSSRHQAEQVASKFAVALSTYDSTNPDATIKGLTPLITKAYAAEFAKGATPDAGASGTSGLSAAAGGQAVTVRGQVGNVYLAEIKGDTAIAICDLSSVLESGGQSLAVPGTRYLRMTMQRESGTWKVSNAEVFAGGGSGASGSAGTSGASGASGSTAPTGTSGSS